MIKSCGFLLFFLLNLNSVFAQNDSASSKFVFISDTQAPMWIEDLFLKSDENVKATEILLNDIPNQNPDEIYFLGDIVNLGYKDNRWGSIDSCIFRIRSSGLDIHACLGNHELMGNSKKGEANFQTRFPDHVNTGYTVISDSVATIFLNSNFSKMSKDQIVKQDKWYEKEMASLDSLVLVKTIIVCCHHSPFSDSKLVGSSKYVQDKFVNLFLKSKKSGLFVSGHAHMFQHFKVSGKDFLVIGGGGGLNHPVNKKSCGYEDLSKDYKPMFHYLTVERFSDHFKIVSHRLKKDFSGVEEGFKFEIDLRANQ